MTTMIRTVEGLMALEHGTRVTTKDGTVYERVIRDQLDTIYGDAEVEAMVLVYEGELVYSEFVDLDDTWGYHYTGQSAARDFVAYDGPFEIKEA